MRYLTANLAASWEYKWLDGRKYLVAPVTMLVPGVLPGSKGPLYYPLDEIKRNVKDWDRIPLVLKHPFRNGQNVSAFTPGVLDEQGIGFITNPTANDKLKAKAWFDVARTEERDPRILTALQQSRPIELSTGLYTSDQLADNGAEHNGRAYTHIARRYVPDHLAILPDEVGACSINDGCGVLVNSRHIWSPVSNVGDNCGTGAGGFQSGNSCAKGSNGGVEGGLSSKGLTIEATPGDWAGKYKVGDHSFGSKKDATTHIKKVKELEAVGPNVTIEQFHELPAKDRGLWAEIHLPGYKGMDIDARRKAVSDHLGNLKMASSIALSLRPDGTPKNVFDYWAESAAQWQKLKNNVGSMSEYSQGKPGNSARPITRSQLKATASKINARLLADIRNFGKELSKKVMPGYGQVYYNSKSKEVWYVGGDSDEQPFYDLVESKFSALKKRWINSVRKLTSEAEAFPKGEGWQKIWPGTLKSNEMWQPASVVEPGDFDALDPKHKPLYDEITKAAEWLSENGLAPGRGEVYYNHSNKQIWYVGTEGDAEGFSNLVNEELASIKGVSRVKYRIETFPPLNQNWHKVWAAEPIETPEEIDPTEVMPGMPNAIPNIVPTVPPAFAANNVVWKSACKCNGKRPKCRTTTNARIHKRTFGVRRKKTDRWRNVPTANCMGDTQHFGSPMIAEAPDGSLNRQIQDVTNAYHKQYPHKYDSDTGRLIEAPYIVAVFDDYVICSQIDGELYRHSYRTSGANITFVGKPTAIKPTITFEPV